MIVEMLPALPLFTKYEQSHIEDIRVEFIPVTSRFCTDKGNDPFNLKSKILAMFRVNPAPGGNK